MKVREGFVSNSSSSSYILKVGEQFASVREVAAYMIKKQIDEARYENGSWKDEFLKQEKDNLKKLKTLKPDQPVTFRSCNYDTYIRRVADTFLIATCNNTDWGLSDGLPELTPAAVRSLRQVVLSHKRKLKLLEISGVKIEKKKRPKIKGAWADDDEDRFDCIKDYIDDPRKYDEFYLKSWFYDFYSLEFGVIGVETFDDCEVCKSDVWRDDDHWFCPKCGKQY